MNKANFESFFSPFAAHVTSLMTLILQFSYRKLKVDRVSWHLTALFTNMRILKFKSQLTIAFFAAVNHL